MPPSLLSDGYHSSLPLASQSWSPERLRDLAGVTQLGRGDEAQRGRGAHANVHGQRGDAGTGGLVFLWGGCILLCVMLVIRAGAARCSPQGVFPHANHYPHSEEVKLCASECGKARGGEMKLMSVIHTLV